MKLVCIQGTTEECLAHFSHQIGNDYKRRKAICDLMGVHKETGYDWFTKLRTPTGLNLLRLRCLLSLVGYAVNEMESLAPRVRLCAELVGLNVISIDGFVSDMEYHKDTAFRVLLGRQGTSSQADQKLAKFDASKDRLAEVKAGHLKTLGFTRVNGSAATPVKIPTITVEQPIQPCDREQTLVSLSHLVSATLFLAEKVAGDEFTPEDRQRLRKLTATQRGRSNGVFELYQALGALCSERARNHQNS